MTYFHFINCVALTFIPPIILYKAKRLSGKGGFNVLTSAFFFYLATQFIKLLLEGTLPPAIEDSFDVKREFFGILLTSLDFMAIYYMFTFRFANEMLLAGLGWAVSESLVKRMIPLWIEARGLEFDPKFMIVAIDANIYLLFYISLATVIFILYKNTDNNLPLMTKVILMTMLALQPTISFLQKKDIFTGLAIRLAWTIVIAGLAKWLYTIHTTNKTKKN
eukprot:TRINITY_DN2703_c0_g1_i1.p1 TRINITY_DN2703_c0_g1~~TRINITY_DN2703_c0_g1_i1.p1  ORF type:complete len:220 (-),score=28.37 TRINITY_DN2703_c0_g1_i1:13-672(-)